MEKFVYLLERQKYIWRNNDWVANQMSSAWSTAVFNHYSVARMQALHDYSYMFSDKADCMHFEKFADVNDLKEESVVGRIVYTYRCCGEDYKVIYRVTKKQVL